MSIDLILEVMDHAPADLTSGERMVLTVIAERANDKTRVAKQSTRWDLDVIAHRAGVKRSGLKSIFQGLARKGCEVRIPVKFNPDGKPIFAFEGTAVTFRIPHLAERGGPGIPSERGGQSIPTQRPEGMPQHPRGVAVASERGGHSNPQSLMTLKEPSNPSLSDTSSSASATREPASDRERDDETSSEDQNQPPPADTPHRLLAKRGVHGDRADYVIGFIESQNTINHDGWWYRADGNGSLDDWIGKATNLCRTCGGKGQVWSETFGSMVGCHHCPGTAVRDVQPRTSQRVNPNSIRNSHDNVDRYDVPIGAYPGAGPPSAEVRKARGWLAEGEQAQAAWERSRGGYQPYRNRPDHEYEEWTVGQSEITDR